MNEMSDEEKIEILHKHSINNYHIEEYVKTLSEEEFYWFMYGLTNEFSNELDK